MMRLLRRLLPRRIAAQSAAVVIASALLIHLALSVYFQFLETRNDDQRRAFVHVGTLVRLIAATAPGEARATLVADAAHAFPSLGFAFGREEPVVGHRDRGRQPRGPSPFDVAGADVRVVEIGPPDWEPPPDSSFGGGGPPPGNRRVAFGFPGGDWLTVTETTPPPAPPFFFGPFTAAVFFAGLSSLLLGLWAARGLVGPLRALEAAARDFDIEAETVPLPRRGPEEVQVAATAFEAMSRRIRSLVDDRTRMLAAMGHDLRTPITRLRLRSEFVADETLRAEFQRDLDTMNAMIEGALTYLREGRHAEASTLVDLSATLQTITDDWTDRGRAIVYEGPDHLVWRVRSVAMTRALANLVDNAMKYGTSAVVRLRPVAAGVRIEVEDDGPGIAAGDREAMLRPFVRGDAARNMDDHHGFGLGLAIVRAVVEGHGGRLELADATPHGLWVRIDLPAPPHA